VRSDGYLYVTFEDGTGYSKLAKLPGVIQDIYPYDESMNQSIINAIGTDDWSKMGVQNRL
jgi:hypothetical protein